MRNQSPYPDLTSPASDQEIKPMIDRSIHELESSSYRHFSKGGVAPSRYQLAINQNRQKRLRTFEMEEIEKRRRTAETQVETATELLSRVVRRVASVLNTDKLHRVRR